MKRIIFNILITILVIVFLFTNFICFLAIGSGHKITSSTSNSFIISNLIIIILMIIVIILKRKHYNKNDF